MSFNPGALISRSLPTSLKAQMICLVFLLVFSLTLIAGGLYTAMISEVLEDQIGKRALQVSRTVAQLPMVKHQIVKPRPEGKLQALAEKIREEVGAEFIVIGNRDGIRFSHPKPDRLGKKMVGGDNAPALERGESYVSRAVGTLGPSIRGKVPIFDESGGIVGVVSVGYLQENVRVIIHDHQLKVGVLVGVLVVFGILGAVSISNRFKRAIFDLEPEQIARLLTERETIIDSIREGVVAIDRHANVTVVNRQAIVILGKDSESQIIGQPIKDVLPGAKLSRILSGGEQRHDQELEVNGTIMLINTVPMIEQDTIIGAVASFRRRDELDILAKQFSQVKEYSEMLRAQTHEYSNKLHTIAGLIQIDHDKEALELISQETAGYQGLIAFLAKAVPFPVLAAFILGKYNHAQELRIEFEIDPDSQLKDVPSELSREKLVTILGNLLDNAFDAALQGEHQAKVKLSMTDVSNDLVFEVEDSGAGVPAEKSEQIFERGFTTKQNDRGHGLYLARKALRDLGGQITLSDSDLGGALFSVFIPKQGRF
ncbi:MAG: sensor histidine kinase [Desulfuromonadales bacterium]|jgi:sensor histidine kinase regulating citrate/malate metabolism|nr:sensor histidine kinase [Desulfuromonadales bacterium]MDH3869339.1 sensor histidine kinase [Desulfuromonadales bacterium]MDH3959994.1 sensor histidine kinase [Desulfuromonadales bacterium]MDH4023839.1 sensor histidine kinase [Desulfuromonadales bacterium]HKJ28952.1 sensor histidine kinase [Desulfuromonadales bacterium]